MFATKATPTKRALPSSHAKAPKKTAAAKARPPFVPPKLVDRPAEVDPIPWPHKARKLAEANGVELPKGRRWLASCEVPIRIESEANKREHWHTVKARSDEQRNKTMAVVGELLTRIELKLPPHMVVVLTRIGPKTLDDDNLARGHKAQRDAIAYLVGIDDGHSRVRYEYQQRKGKPKEYATRVDFYEVGE